MRHQTVPQVIPSWTGFHIAIRNDIPVLKATVSYLESINKPATEMTTIYQVLEVI